LASVLLIFIFQAIVAAFYFFYKIRLAGTVPRTIEIDPLLVVISVAATFPAHLLTLLICYLVVTDRGRRPFLKTLGWDWHPQFKWVHAVGLAFLMFAVAVGLEQLLPHRETELERILKMGTSVRVLVASLAVLTAPLVEEVVYRGVLYTGIERNWGKASGIFLVTGLFALVHVPQYWGSYAAIMGILTLSLVLTWLRAATGKLLPCVATHLVYNGIQSFLVLWAPENLLENAPTKTAIALICRCLGVG
jgi:membrane protease YdiL (CAAX protease family)